MSKRTDGIYKSLENLNNLQKDLDDFTTTVVDISQESEKKLSDISFNMKQELKNLTFWIDSLYKYNGKSTSLIKKSSSAENGKKGGRPPKAITEAKKEIKILEEEIIPELDHKILMADSNEELDDLRKKREDAFDKIVKAKSILKKN